MMDWSQIRAWYDERAIQYPEEVVTRIRTAVGLPAGGIDSRMVDALREYQRSVALVSDGLAGTRTVSALCGDDIRHVPDAPRGIRAIRATFGEPGSSIIRTLAPVTYSGESAWIWCHRLVEPAIQRAFHAIRRDGLSSCIKSFDGCYVLRRKRTTSASWSTHAWGIAFDVNAADNPMTSKTAMRISDEQRLLAPHFEAEGFHWGASFGDPMHWQYCRGY